jgi:hypothetical protein
VRKSIRNHKSGRKRMENHKETEATNSSKPALLLLPPQEERKLRMPSQVKHMTLATD